MKKNIFLRVALVLLTLTLGVTSVSFAFTGARFESQNIMSNEFAVYHLISFVRTGLGRGTLNASFIGTGASHTTFNNAPAGEWAFFVRGGHGTDQDLAGSGRPGVFMGIFDKTTAGSFTVGVIQGAARTGPAIGTTNSGHGGHMAYIMSNRTFPTSNPGNTTGFVAIAGGGGGRGGDNNMRGGDAGGQTGIAGAANWRFINGVVSPAPTYPTWSETGFLGGFSGNQGNTANQAHTTSNTGGTTGSGGGGGAGVTGGRATGGQNGNANFAAGWVIGAAGTAAGSGG
ncbi:MAG: hypothetical protein FWB76_08460, partial [Oscillospiraceae bacterium]|nr:hypothetical protein [Oscillospiraceae bacterium]